MKLSRWKPWIVDAGLVLLATGLAYLPLVGQLGYTYDDWFPTAAKVSGVGLAAMHAVDRPLLGQLYAIFDRLLGAAPLGWHIAGFVLRGLGALAFLWLVRMLWSGQRAATLAMAVLLAIYPGFLRQVNANNYLNHFTAFGLGVLSLGLSVFAVRLRQRWMQLAVLLASGVLTWLYPRIFEALVGLEALRLVLLWYVLTPQETLIGWWRRARGVLLWAAPNIFALGVVLYWRLFRFQAGRSSVDAGALLGQYRSDPVGMLLRLMIETGKDFIETVILAWFVPLYQRIANASVMDIALGLLVVLVGLAVLRFMRIGDENKGKSGASWAREAVWMGALGVLLTLVPVILLDRDVQFSHNLDRYTLQSIPAAVMLLVGWGETALRSSWRKPVFGLLLGLALLTHFLNAAQARDMWAIQKQVWWQLSWRAPGLQPETALVITLPEGYRLAEDFEIWAPANLIYSYPPAALPVITAEVLTPETAPQIASDQQIWRGYRNIGFTKKFNFALVASMPTRAACLHVLDGRAPEFSSVEDALVRAAGVNSHLEQIVTGVLPRTPPSEIFGAEPPHGWCYHYQRASLARQMGDWSEVARLGDEARAVGLAPADAVEWLPFYQAYQAMERSDDAAEIAEKIREDEVLVSQLCAQATLSGNVCEGVVP